MEKIVFAKSKYIPTSARKTRLVVDLIRGKNVQQAMDILKFTNKAIAKNVYKTVYSALSNAVNNFSLDRKKLVIAQAYVNEAPTFKRGRATARGRYHQILKRNCHIVIAVKELEEIKKSETVKDVKEKKKTVALNNKFKKIVKNKKITKSVLKSKTNTK